MPTDTLSSRRGRKKGTPKTGGRKVATRLEVRSTGDPAGESFSPHGVATSAADVLRKHGVDLQFFSGANRVDRRDMAIQTVAGYMRRLTPQGPAFKVSPQFVVVTKRGSTTTPVLVDGFECPSGRPREARSGSYPSRRSQQRDY